jgi:hypothetical protein
MNNTHSVTYLEGLQLVDLPEVSSVKKAYGNVLGDFPNWTFQDRDTTEATRRINVAKRFLSIYRKG